MCLFIYVLAGTHAMQGHTFFLDGPGGTGETYVYATLCHHLQSRGKVVLCMASSGIAALLLPGGQTAHSMFKILINSLDNNSFCNIAKDSQQAALLCKVDLFIWDKSLMQHQNAPEALDWSLQDICDCDHLLVERPLSSVVTSSKHYQSYQRALKRIL